MIAVVADFDIGSVQVEADVAQVFFLLSKPRREFVGWTFRRRFRCAFFVYGLVRSSTM